MSSFSWNANNFGFIWFVFQNCLFLFAIYFLLWYRVSLDRSDSGNHTDDIDFFKDSFVRHLFVLIIPNNLCSIYKLKHNVKLHFSGDFYFLFLLFFFTLLVISCFVSFPRLNSFLSITFDYSFFTFNFSWPTVWANFTMINRFKLTTL